MFFQRAPKPTNAALRPQAPPPPLPTNQAPAVPSAQLKPNGMLNKAPQTVPVSKPSPPREPSINNKPLPIRPAPIAPALLKNLSTNQQSAMPTKDNQNAPPPPPVRVSSYIDSTEHRFHFLPVHELPSPDAFIGFHKEYNANNRRSGPNVPPAY